VVAAVAILLLIAYALTREPAGFDAIKPDKPVQEHKLREKEKESEKHTPRVSDGGGKSTPLRPLSEDPRQAAKRSKAAKDVDVPLVSTPHNFGPPKRATDSPNPGPERSAPRPSGDVSPQDLGSENDPVMETPK
jgi:hypothetical protein